MSVIQIVLAKMVVLVLAMTAQTPTVAPALPDSVGIIAMAAAAFVKERRQDNRK